MANQKYNFFGFANGAGFAKIPKAAYQALKEEFHREYATRFGEKL